MEQQKVKPIKIDVLTQTGEVKETMKLMGEVFAIEPHEQAMYDAVRVSLANSRQATAKSKKRGEVSGGGRKPWRQKGTGRARAGSIRSPIWVGGGQAFGPTGEQNYKLAQNKSEHRLALKSALSLKAKENKILVVDSLNMEAIKTKDAIVFFKNIKAEGKVLIVTTNTDANFFNSVRNLRHVIVTEFDNVSVYDLLNSNFVVFEQAAIKSLQEVLQ
jgi:large subunit ribosomal protein L4